MARDVNRYESILLDRMVKIRNDSVTDAAVKQIILLLDCICDFRDPPEGLAVEDGFGVMAREVGE